MADVLKKSTDARDRHRKAYSLYNGLMDTLKGLAYLEEFERRETLVKRAKGELLDVVEPRGRRSRQWSATKDLERLSGCQSEWIGFKPLCCGGDAVAVPIGCNHRLCPLCNNHRAERYRSRVQTLFGHLSNPQLLTLTVPSPKRMTREVLEVLRARLKAFLKENRALLQGGVYSIEVTYNKRSKTWHPHVHILVDVAGPAERLPWKQFVARKRKLEFSWLVLTQGKRRKGERTWKAKDYDEWNRAVDAGAGDFVAGGGRNRRIVDLRQVTKDRKAAYEVLKYMAKAASFIGDPYALKQLLVAIKGVRQIQTFGSCYGFKFEDDAPAESHFTCPCGTNDFQRIGTLGLGMVRLSPEGTWYVRPDAPVHGRRCRGHATPTPEGAQPTWQ